MPFESRRPNLVLTQEEKDVLSSLSRSRVEATHRVERARILLGYAAGETISAVARMNGTNRPKVERCVDKALQIGAIASLSDLPGRGKPAIISDDARAWVVSLACQKPKDFGYSYELWTTKLLSTHIRKHCKINGYPSLAKISRGTVSKILTKQQVRPHKIKYYLEKRDPDFEAKMAQVLYVYKEVSLLRETNKDVSSIMAVVSYDEKPGIQAIGNIAPDLPPVPGEHTCVARDYEYKRLGTVTLQAGIDLISGRIHGKVVDRNRSREFISFLGMLDKYYHPQAKIKIILDNHSSHVSKETRAYLATVPNRFEFVFTPKHGSWLNIIETFFSKMTRTMLRGIRVSSKEEMKKRIKQYLKETNRMPVVFRWKYGLDDIAVT